ncbi:MAG: AAA family ATPase [Pseudomonadota bacterium]
MSNQNRARTIAITNQKGGVGKTTTTINLAAALAEGGASVLILDLDPQGNASTGLGIDPSARDLSTYDLILDDVALSDVTVPTRFEKLSIVPATIDLSSADVELVHHEKRVFLLRDSLQSDGLRGYDYVLIDCPPSLNLLTVNAMVAADSVLVPLQAEFFALEGLSQLMQTLRQVRETANPALRIEGIVLTMYDTRNNLCHQVEGDARENLGDLVFKTRVPRNVRLSEAPSFAVPVLHYDSGSRGSAAYRALAREVVDRQFSHA